MGKNKNLPVVALTGRPNVGKSTLFNRLLHKRRAITSPIPGVTRDPVGMDTVILGRPLRLVDTGGFKLDRDEETPEGELETIVVERTIEVLKKSSLVVLLLEAGEIKGEDEEFISLLRPYQKKLLVAVNKTEGGRRGEEAWNLLSYGFDKVYMISAEHGDNVYLLEEAIVDRLEKLSGDGSSPEGATISHHLLSGQIPEEAFPSASLAEAPIAIALLGKPNTGKSTLSNRLTSSSASIVSDIPGTTRDVIEGSFSYKKRNFFILDTAGIRRKAKVNKNIEYYSVNRAIKSIDEADIVFLIIDANEGLTDQDKKIAALAHDKGRGIILVLNKWDMMPGANDTSGKKVFINARNRIHFLFGQMEYAPIIPVSALNGNGVNKLLDTTIQMYRQLKLQIATSVLNQSLEKWLIEYPPPAGRGRFKIRYAVQTQANPVKFVFFASRPDAVSDSYVAYLRNRIRRDLGFSIIPVSIELRPSSNSDKHPEGKPSDHLKSGQTRRRLADKPKMRR
ncbi:MAG: ribosome biogenesis GTPase Der [Treponema sp.]|nr:ribosome biogenesis GTPase Der [Treponema sp.]